MPDPPVIKTSLAERIARLNAANSQYDRLSASASSSSIPGQIKAKISKYEGQGDAPLLPKGSFGLGVPVQRASAGLDRMRIASMGVSGGVTPNRSLSPGRPPHLPPGSGTRSVSSSAARGSRPSSPRIALDTGSDVCIPNSSARLSAMPCRLGEANTESIDSLTGSTHGGDAPPTGLAIPISPLSDVRVSGTTTPPGNIKDHKAQVEQMRKNLGRLEADNHDHIAKADDVAPAGNIDGKLVEPPPVATLAPLVQTFAPVTLAPPFVPPNEEEQDLGSMSLSDAPAYAVPRHDSPGHSDYQTSRDEMETPYHTDDGASQDGSQYAYSDILDSYPAGGEAAQVPNRSSTTLHDIQLLSAPAPEPEVLEGENIPTFKCSDCGAQVGILDLGEHVCARTDLEASLPVTPRADNHAALPPSPSTMPPQRISVRPPPLDVPDDDLDSISNAEAVDRAAAALHDLALPDVPVSAVPSEPETPHMHSSPTLQYDMPAGMPATPPSAWPVEGPDGSRANLWDDSPASLRKCQPNVRRQSWMDDDEDSGEGTGYVTIIRR